MMKYLGDIPSGCALNMLWMLYQALSTGKLFRDALRKSCWLESQEIILQLDRSNGFTLLRGSEAFSFNSHREIA